MLIFWCLVALMIVPGLFIVLRPLFRRPSIQADDTNQRSVVIYRERLAELERDKDLDVLSPDQMEAAKRELERSLLAEIDDKPGKTDKGAGNTKPFQDRITAGLITLLLPVIAVSIYFRLGQPDLIAELNKGSAQRNAGMEQKDTPSIEVMVEKLARRMQKEPGDKKGWLMLGRSYMVLGRYRDAVSAFERLRALTGDEPDVLLHYANALAMANGSKLAGRPEELIQKTLQLDPDNNNAMWMAGMAAYEQGNYNAAIAYWQRLLPRLESGSKALPEIKQLIKRAQAGLDTATGDSVSVTAVNKVSPDGNNKTISVNVALASHLVEQADQTDTLFIYAQVQEGPPMPIAVLRKQVKDLPLQVTLDDSMAILPSRKLSGFHTVMVSARISKSGNATPHSGDLSAQPVEANVGQADPVSLLIDKQFP
ncbi:MAG: c-type cytochrome biogenesis protein CcmI [Gammaproteobacteria bacterium]